MSGLEPYAIILVMILALLGAAIGGHKRASSATARLKAVEKAGKSRNAYHAKKRDLNFELRALERSWLAELPDSEDAD